MIEYQENGAFAVHMEPFSKNFMKGSHGHKAGRLARREVKRMLAGVDDFYTSRAANQ